jgi:hypothetical protein
MGGSAEIDQVPTHTAKDPTQGAGGVLRCSVHVQVGLEVEVAGIEPASVGEEPGLLRAQLAVVFLSLSDHASKSLPGSVT